MNKIKRVPLFSGKSRIQKVAEQKEIRILEPLDPMDQVFLCNCCECSVSLFANLESKEQAQKLSPAQKREFGIERTTEVIRGRIHGRPYCNACLDTRHMGVGGGYYQRKGETSPSWENAIRSLEN